MSTAIPFSLAQDVLLKTCKWRQLTTRSINNAREL